VSRSGLWWLAKLLQGAGLLVVLVGLSLSMGLGLEDEGLSSMAIEMKGLALGGALFVLGVWLERRLGAR